PVPLPMAHEPMLLLAVTEFVANSAAFTYFTAGALRRSISSDMLPQKFPLQLRTKSMEVFSPQLQERYPDQPMELHLWARRQPLLSFHPDALHGTLFSSAEALVVLPNATRVPAFLLNIDANVTGKPTITRNRLAGTVRLTGLVPNPELALPAPQTLLPALCWAQTLPVPQVKPLETLLKFGLWLFGVPRANSKCCPCPVP
ncbi:BPI protein, partial [Chaetorhynchus papuensis]|nr:BPI protein [Chaetorhynchus papuensis]